MHHPGDNLATASRLKIQRAGDHIAELEREIAVYLARAPFTLMETVGQDGNREFVPRTNEPIPDSFALIIGDCVHNLRSALDLAMYAMASPSADKPERIQFPFCKSAGALKEALESCRTKFAGQRVVAAITELKPYPGGDDELVGLHQLDINDKHRLIITMGRAPVYTAGQLNELSKGRGVKFEGTGEVRVHGVVRLPRVPGVMSNAEPITADVQPTFRICFAEGQPFAFDVVLDQLRSLSTRVQTVVDLLFAQYQPPST